LALPSGIPTHQHNATKRWTRLDQVFLSDHSLEALISSNVQEQWRGINTDHLPILTILDLTLTNVSPAEIRNFRDVDWEQFREALGKRLAVLGVPHWITTQAQLDDACTKLTHAIQDAITDKVPASHICPKSKRWWTRELTMLRRQANKLGRQAYKLRGHPSHPIHEEHATASKLY
ncbi:hypothetical protein BJV78DRAFT_1102233, partial [Lactifluus subvellereus]